MPGLAREVQPPVSSSIAVSFLRAMLALDCHSQSLLPFLPCCIALPRCALDLGPRWRSQRRPSRLWLFDARLDSHSCCLALPSAALLFCAASVAIGVVEPVRRSQQQALSDPPRPTRSPTRQHRSCRVYTWHCCRTKTRTARSDVFPRDAKDLWMSQAPTEHRRSSGTAVFSSCPLRTRLSSSLAARHSRVCTCPPTSGARLASRPRRPVERQRPRSPTRPCTPVHSHLCSGSRPRSHLCSGSWTRSIAPAHAAPGEHFTDARTTGLSRSGCATPRWRVHLVRPCFKPARAVAPVSACRCPAQAPSLGSVREESKRWRWTVVGDTVSPDHNASRRLGCRRSRRGRK